jgi:hypothetical protein
MKPSTALLLLAAIGFTWSCSKDISPNEGTKLLRVESDYKTGDFTSRTFIRNPSDNLVAFQDSSNAGTFESISIEYGSGDRISKIKFLNTAGQTIFHFELEYNTDGRVSKRLTVPGTLNIADDYNTYTYDAAGHLIIDSQYQKSGLPPAYQITKVSNYTYTGDNITEAFLYLKTTGTLDLYQRRKYEYDNKINPYKNFKYLYFIMEGNSSIEAIVCMSAGNVVKDYAAMHNTVYELAQVYKYQYNSSGYPWKVKHEIDLNGQGLREGEFFYKQ